MHKRVIKYEDFDGNHREEECYFGFTQTELNKMNLSTEGGLLAMAERIISTQNGKELCELFDKIILGSYGIKSLDGRRFEKSEEISREFSQTLAYDQLFSELSTDAHKFAEFFNNVLPKESQISADKLNDVVKEANAKISN